MELHLLTFGFNIILFGLSGCQAEERYVCISCQYQPGVVSTECIDEAENVTTSEKCQGICATESRYEKDTMEVKFVRRGCATVAKVEDKCVANELEYQCSSTCAGHFCNDESAVMSTASPLRTTIRQILSIVVIAVFLM